MAFPRFLLTVILSAHAASTAHADWSFPAPVEKLDVSYVCPRAVAAGPFTLSAELVLHSLDGTAASVWFGTELNLGFDGGKTRSLFIEGPAAGGTSRPLEAGAGLIRAGEPFGLEASRDTEGMTVFRIQGEEVFRTWALKDKTLTITFRPHRNTMDIRSATLAGELAPPLPLLECRVPIVPLFVGEKNTVLDLTFRLDSPRILDGVDVKNVGIPLERHWVDDVSKRNFGPPEAFVIHAGEHPIRIVNTVPAEADLLGRVQTKFSAVRFRDGSRLEGPATDLAFQRLAYPIHKRGEYQCDTFRIPGLARTVGGTLLAVYDMRYDSPRDLQGHMDIGLSRSTDGGQTWEPPRPIMDRGEFGGRAQKVNGCSDPNILVDQTTGEIFVSALWTHGKPNTHQWHGNGSEPGFEIGKTAQFMVVRSTDAGITWSEPENWTRKLKQEEWWLFAPAPGNGITMRDGTLVMPTQGRDAEGLPFSNLMWSRDHGENWTLGTAARHDTTECAVAELSDGSLMLNIRDNRNRADKGETNGRAVSVTTDLGKTWSVHPSDHGLLPEPTCMASLISHTLPDGRHVLFFSNPNDKHARRNITIQASLDNGKSWPESHRVLLDEGSGYGYSCLTVLDDETLGILYESSRADMTFQKIPITDLLAPGK